MSVVGRRKGVGGFALLVVVLRRIYALLDFLGNADFVVTKLKEAGAEKVLAGWAPWLDIGLALFGVTMLVWAFWPKDSNGDQGPGDQGTVHSTGAGSVSVGLNKGIVNQTVNPPPSESSYSGILRADGVVLDSRSPEAGSVQLQIGAGALFRWTSPRSDFFDMARKHWLDNRLLLERINGELKVSTRIHNVQTGVVVAELIRNEWKAAKEPTSWDRNYSHDALEVKDETGDIVLQVRALQDRIQLQGKWYLGHREWTWPDGETYSGPAVMVLMHPEPDGVESLIVPITSAEEAAQYHIEPIFEYPSSTKLGCLRSGQS